MNTTISFLDDDVEILDAVRHHDTVSVEVRAGGDTLRLHLHEDLYALLAQAALDAKPYQPDGWSVPVDTACPDDPDGLHFVGCTCGEES